MKKSHFALNPEKTRMQYQDSRQEVTGLLVNKRINVRPEYRRLVRAMTHHLTTKGKFHVKTTSVDLLGKPIESKVDGKVSHLQGMFGFIDWIDQRQAKHHPEAKRQDESEEKEFKTPSLTTSTERMYKRFLMHRDFWSSDKPLILCEGKTDSIYLRGAIRQLVAKHPLLATPAKKTGEVEYAVRFFNYSDTAQRVLGLTGGANCVKGFISNYLKRAHTAPKPPHQQPVILLIDHDDAAKDFYAIIKNYSGKKAVTGLEDFHHLKQNVYVVFTPIEKTGDASTIEDLFDAEVLATKLDGKTLHRSNDKLDDATEYSKWAFATRVIRPNVAKTDFSKFDTLLTRIEAAIKEHQSKST